jgi:hypothetical protein
MPVFPETGRLDLRLHDTGHPLTYEEVAEAKLWLSEILRVSD